MIIDEPKTPFVHGYDINVDLKEFHLDSTGISDVPGTCTTENDSEEMLESDRVISDSNNDADQINNEVLSSRQEFNKSRKDHYGNMKGLLKHS